MTAPLAHRPHLLVDARPIFHATAGGRGIGNYVRGLLDGLQSIGASFDALVSGVEDRCQLGAAIGLDRVATWSRSAVRDAPAGSWYLATGMFLHPISFDPIPAAVTEAMLPVASIMYDVIPFRRAATHLVHTDARRMARLRAELTRNVDAVLAISRFAAKTAIAELGLDSRRVHVVGAGVAERFRPAPASDPAWARPPELGSGPYVVAVVGSDPHKNVERLIDSWATVARRVDGVSLVLVGGGPPAWDVWRRRIDDAGVGARAIVAGSVDDATLVRLLQHAAVSVTPSLDEGFGLPVLEAAACGCPAICSDASSLPEILDEPAACFDPADAGAIADALVRALRDPAHRAVLRAAGERAAQRWTWPHAALAVEQAIAASTLRWGAMRQLRRRLALVGPSATEPVVSALAEADPSVEVWWGTVGWERRAPGALHTFDAAGFGRYVRDHDVDDLVVCVDRPASQAARIAAQHPAHIWLQSPDPAIVEWRHARSAIVPDVATARAVGDRGDGELRILVLDDPVSPAAVAAALGRFLVDLGAHRGDAGAAGYHPAPS
jgi:glycosyltransferase involved in cell wall biosynthesis